MIVGVTPGEGSGAAAARRVAVPGTGGVVGRPGLLRRLGGPARVTMVSAPAGSGKTVLLRSWIAQAALGDRVAWVSAGRAERDPQRFWLSVVTALRGTAPGPELVQALTAAPGLDGWTVVERLLAELAPLEASVWLVIDDAHELGPEALRQLELLIMRAPPGLRFVLAARHDVRLGLHRLRLEGELAEIREPDLRFTVAETRELLEAAGVTLPERAVLVLQERTEGWAAGLRLAAMSLAGHPDPERFAAEFSGSERTVAEYLLAEVLDRQPESVRMLLLRTSILERVNGELADLLTGGSGGERTLQDLEQAHAFVVSMDAARTCFRYHQLFAGLLQLELRRTAPGEVAGLHRLASQWLAGHGFPAEAIRHAQAAADWEPAARLLADCWPGLYLDGQAAIIHELLAGFPAEAPAGNAELAALAAADELARGSAGAAEGYLELAERGSAAVPAGRREHAQLLLGMVRLLLARQRADLPAVVAAARAVQDMAGPPDLADPGLGEDLRALALISLGTTEVWAARLGEAARDLERGVALAHRIGRPFLEFTGLAHLSVAAIYSRYPRAADGGLQAVEWARRHDFGLQAVELARRHGWNDEPATGIACSALGSMLAWQGRLAEAEHWIQRAATTVRMEAEPAAAVAIYYVRGLLELARGRNADALAAFRTAEQLAAALAVPHYLLARTRALLLLAMVRLGENESAEQFLGRLGDHDRDRAEIRVAIAALRLAEDDPRAATLALAPVLDVSAPVEWRTSLPQGFLVEAIARDALGEPDAAEAALERALDLAEPSGTFSLFLLYPVAGLLGRHAGHRTAHASLIADIQSVLAGRELASPSAGPAPLSEPLLESEIRVLRYLPTNLSGPEIAGELSVSRNTVKTHLRSLYAKLGAHRRAEAVARARALGLLAPSGRGIRRELLPAHPLLVRPCFYVRGDLVHQPDFRAPDQFPGPGDADEEADHHEHGDRVHRPGVGRVNPHVDALAELDDEDNGKPEDEPGIAGRLPSQMSPAQHRHQGGDHEEQPEARDDHRGRPDLVSRDQREQRHRERVGEGRERRRRADAVQLRIDGLLLEPPRGNGDGHEEQPDQGAGGRAAGREEIVNVVRDHQKSFPRFRSSRAMIGAGELRRIVSSLSAAGVSGQSPG
jgi:LuxR family maltose regulon positive regulatory protein